MPARLGTDARSADILQRIVGREGYGISVRAPGRKNEQREVVDGRQRTDRSPLGRLFGTNEAFPRNPSMSRRATLPVPCAAALTLAAVPGLSRVGVVVGVAPPAPVVETVPAPPGPGYVWRPGYWSWDGVQYVWGPGTYLSLIHI